MGATRRSASRTTVSGTPKPSRSPFPTVAAMREGFRDELSAHVYTRGNNPTVEILRTKVAALGQGR